MTDLPLLLGFLSAVVVLTVTPGVDTAMVLRAATLDGARQAIKAACGIALGCMLWGAAVSLGLGALLLASKLAYSLLKIAGAAYLIWLGAKMILRPHTALAAIPGEARRNAPSAFARGFLTNILNPKVGMFYVAFLPQFVPPGTNVTGYVFFLASLHVLLTLLWFGFLISASTRLGRLLRQQNAMRALDRFTGGVIMLFGLKLATSTAH